MYSGRERKRLRLKNYDYSSVGAYFVTICTKNRESFFGEVIDGECRKNEIGIFAQQCWEDIPEHFPNARLYDFIIMPNHIHGIIEIFVNDEHIVPKNVIQAVGNENFRSLQGNETKNVTHHNFRSLQGNETKNIVHDNFCSLQVPIQSTLSSVIKGFKIGVTKKSQEIGIHNFFWQKSFYDVIIRNEKQLFNVKKYIEENPLKWKEDIYNERNQQP